MTFDELLTKVLAIMPDAEAGEDNDGQIVIYSGLRIIKNEKERLERFELEEAD